MGFLDKAKAMAEQAQQKLDEVQKDFNAKQSGGTAGAGGPAVQYDSHGRPVSAGAPPEAPVEPAATGAAPPAEVTPSAPMPPADVDPGGFEPPSGDPLQAASAGDPLAEAAAAPPAPAAPAEDTTPGLTSGDPLAG